MDTSFCPSGVYIKAVPLKLLYPSSASLIYHDERGVVGSEDEGGVWGDMLSFGSPMRVEMMPVLWSMRGRTYPFHIRTKSSLLFTPLV